VWLDPRNSPDWDCSDTPAERAFAIASTPRSGSTLLARYLWDAGIGAPKEYLNPMQRRDWAVRRHVPGVDLLTGRWAGLAGRLPWSSSELAAQLVMVRTYRSQGGWFGLKVHAHHAQAIGLRRIERVLGPVTWLRIRRRDRVAQAASWARALATDQWVATQTPRPSILPLDLWMPGRLRAIAKGEQFWDGELPGSTVDIVYEDLVEDPASVAEQLSRVFERGVVFSEPALVRQADPRHERFVRKWRRRLDLKA